MTDELPRVIDRSRASHTRFIAHPCPSPARWPIFRHFPKYSRHLPNSFRDFPKCSVPHAPGSARNARSECRNAGSVWGFPKCRARMAGSKSCRRTSESRTGRSFRSKPKCSLRNDASSLGRAGRDQQNGDCRRQFHEMLRDLPKCRARNVESLRENPKCSPGKAGSVVDHSARELENDRLLRVFPK